MEGNRVTRRELLLAAGTLAGIATVPFSLAAAVPATPSAAEFFKHFGPLTKLSVAVAQTMPPEKYGFRPHPDSMTFGELMSHIATTNYQFCAGLKDSNPPSMPSPTSKADIVKFLGASFEYCSAAIPNLTENSLNQIHKSPDGRLLGREILLAMYVHVAHHRGQAEIYLRDKGIRPPSYRI